MANYDKIASKIKGGTVPDPESPAPPSMEQDTEQYRGQGDAIDPAAKTDLIIDLLGNLTTAEIEAALAEYSGGGMDESGAPGGVPGEV